MSKHEKKTSSLLHYPVLVVFSLFSSDCSRWIWSPRTAVTASWRTLP